MFTKRYDGTIHNAAGAAETISLRLPFASQSTLGKKYNKDTISLILAAATDNDIFIDILTNALNWKNNTNTITAGEELVEALIDEGIVCDDVSRVRLMIGIGKASGFISEAKAVALEREMQAIEDNLTNEPVEAEADKTETEKN